MPWDVSDETVFSPTPAWLFCGSSYGQPYQNFPKPFTLPWPHSFTHMPRDRAAGPGAGRRPPEDSSRGCKGKPHATLAMGTCLHPAHAMPASPIATLALHPTRCHTRPHLDQLAADLGRHHVAVAKVADTEHEAELAIPLRDDCSMAEHEGFSSLLGLRHLNEHAANEERIHDRSQQ